MNRLGNRIIGLLAALVLSTMTLGACGSGQPVTPQPPHADTSPKTDEQKTRDVVFDPFFVEHFMKDKNATPADLAASMQHRVPRDFKKIYARPDGALIIRGTERQLQEEIKLDTKERSDGAKMFMQGCSEGTCGYHYTLSKDGRHLSVWLDKHLTAAAYMGMIDGMPMNTGYLYYYKGGTGPWDMQVTIYNCHSGQMVNQYMASQILDIPTDNFGD